MGDQREVGESVGALDLRAPAVGVGLEPASHRRHIGPAAYLRGSGGGREHPGGAGTQLLTRGELGDR